MKALILAGGFATRLWPLTEKRAKPMLLIDGKPIIQHIVDQIPAEVETYILTNSQFEPDFKAFITPLERQFHIFCEDSHCDTEKIGALAAVATAIKHYAIEDDILILAGDNLLPQLSLSALYPEANEARLAVQSVPDLDSARSFGVVEFESYDLRTLNRVKTFVEKPILPKSTFVSTGFMSVGQNLLPDLIDFSQKSPDALGAVLTHFITQNHPVFGLNVPGNWFDVGSFNAYLEAHKTLQQHPVEIEPTAKVENCEFRGKVYIGPNAKVNNSLLIDTVVYGDSQLNNCHMSQTIIDSHCQLRGVDLSRKLVRQGTVINKLDTDEL